MTTFLKDSESLETSTSTIAAISYTRLHITPLDESLLGAVVPSSVLPRARNISYHVLETFPENRYGFVDLPTMEAEKIKKKLNGATLRGSKMRVEKANPESIPKPTGETNGTGAKREKIKSKKRKHEVDITLGVELENRKVKRGWTTSEREMIDGKRKKSKGDKKSKDEKEGKKKKKREVKSKYTDGPECLFKTKLPGVSSSSNSSEEIAGQKKKKRKIDRELVIHEFEKTMKHPSFLKSNIEKSTPEAVTFQDGVGWVDGNGNVVESVLSKKPNGNASNPTIAKTDLHKTHPLPEEDDGTSSSGSSSDESDDIEVSAQEVESSDEKEAETKAPPKPLKVETYSLSSPVSVLKTEFARPKSSSSVTSLTIKIPPVTPAAAKVHPLEALYKRPKGDTAISGEVAREAQPFSFFDGNDNDDDDDDDDGDDIKHKKTMGPPSQPPMTPFTKQDFEFRNVRSAAPTPDTAHPSSRTFNLWPRHGSADDGAEDDEDGDDSYGNQGNKVTVTAGVNDQAMTVNGDNQVPTSDFQRQFWESRGDLNRSWRKRRKTASKEKRYRENRARAERAI
ncbi:uncharacterized protein GGS22DRAFT_176165 [Annulohypoxylon maeteangense]|uniref:uncharacterized protein n=1 Tax=Annulohypoxylon maeteangense TaxID=1927788 RepID=UPI002007AB1E|nr:uncharacterized protein GGS22DRAFT_176165 [Annulohypoxylon maeteangense]KAI0879994.1 hypothetical protein GGS22DRAFT_176165 [Annulohypoxylon maeteangense]